MTTKKKDSLPPEPMTLAEHHEYLKKTGRFDEMMEKRRKRREELEKIWTAKREAERPVVEALRSVGLEVDAVWDLLSWDEPYPEAIPILLDHAQRSYPPRVLEAIGRALGVPEARHEWPLLVRLYKQASTKNAKMGLGDALCILAKQDKELLGDIIELVKDERQGPSRLMLLEVLSRSRDPRAYATLVEMRDDPDLYKEIAVILKRKKAPRGSKHSES